MLGRIALRIAAVAALKGATLVGDNVLDSEIGALDVGADGALRTDQEAPFISVYTEGSVDEGFNQGGGADLRSLHICGAQEIVFEFGVTSAMVETDNDGAAQLVGLQIPATDANLELLLDIIERQIVNALTDPLNAWADVFRALHSTTLRIERRRTSSAEGAKVAARQLLIKLELLPDPIYGEPVRDSSVWAKFFAQLEQDDSEQKVKAALQALLGDPVTRLASETQRQRFAMTLEEVRAMFDVAVEPAAATEPNLASFTSEYRP
jgi:hypothetical protein